MVGSGSRCRTPTTRRSADAQLFGIVVNNQTVNECNNSQIVVNNHSLIRNPAELDNSDITRSSEWTATRLRRDALRRMQRMRPNTTM
eukprot:gene10618-biopygen6834